MGVGAVVAAIEPAGFKGDGAAGAMNLPGVGEGGEGTGPGDVAVAG